jgi:hypothetical protein
MEYGLRPPERESFKIPFPPASFLGLDFVFSIP